MIWSKNHLTLLSLKGSVQPYISVIESQCFKRSLMAGFLPSYKECSLRGHFWFLEEKKIFEILLMSFAFTIFKI